MRGTPGTWGGRTVRRAVVVVCALLLAQIGSLIAPAYACGCGAMVPGRQSTMGVDRETSVVRWDGATEQIVMRFTVNGNAPEAAWIMPVPNRAEVELGDPELFGELDALTEPERRTRHYFWPRDGDWPFTSDGDGLSAGAPLPGDAAPPVGVVGRERLGDFDVARLTATDPGALRNWLETNGFELPADLATELQPYVDQEWEYVAVRLAPEEDGARLRGTLDPLRLSFESDRLIYPMRLSRLADQPQSLGLYVLADHRMEPRASIGGDEPEIRFAGRVSADDSPALGELTGTGGTFLTAIDQYFPRPERIDADHELRATASDTPYRRVYYDDELRLFAGVPAWLATVGAVFVALTLLVVGAAVLRVRRRTGGVPLR
ncbi:DUF2330 domain-containing protein [Streptomyces sp. NBC_00838]|uniref:DUF2330 domain-containing protein n=1 Tax=Streptomyces sp. NBC_00838 TaxID=2903680 RepID=UPI00386EB86C|nr:DUF2330 domain-containing protein [Streptomyces sp. NBC_00838]